MWAESGMALKHVRGCTFSCIARTRECCVYLRFEPRINLKTRLSELDPENETVG
jgi:hypothetical protein